MDNVKTAIELFAVPWFHKLEHENYVVMQLLKEKLSSKMSVYNREWLNAIGKRSAQAEIIQENIDKLKLPQSLIC